MTSEGSVTTKIFLKALAFASSTIAEIEPAPKYEVSFKIILFAIGNSSIFNKSQIQCGAKSVFIVYHRIRKKAIEEF